MNKNEQDQSTYLGLNNLLIGSGKLVENKGVFLYLDSVSALDGLRTDAQKWRIVRALVMYAVLGELPDEKMQKNTVFLLLKSMVDNGKRGQKRKKGDLSGEEVESLDNRDIEADFSDSEESSKSINKRIYDGEKKLGEQSKSCFESDDYNKNKNKNKNKNENKNENKNSSSGVASGEEVKNVKSKVKDEEEEKMRKRAIVSSPTLGEVQEFITITKVKVDPVCFYEYHEAKNWRVGGRYVSDWRACVLEWDRRERRKALREKEKEEELKTKGLTRDYSEEDRRNLNSMAVSLDNIEEINELLK